jgi:hypothetical protein
VESHFISSSPKTVVVMVTGYSHGQSGSHNGKLEGSIVDSSGALIAHAEVNLLNENTGDAKAKTADVRDISFFRLSNRAPIR